MYRVTGPVTGLSHPTSNLEIRRLQVSKSNPLPHLQQMADAGMCSTAAFRVVTGLFDFDVSWYHLSTYG